MNHIKMIAKDRAISCTKNNASKSSRGNTTALNISVSVFNGDKSLTSSRKKSLSRNTFTQTILSIDKRLNTLIKIINTTTNSQLDAKRQETNTIREKRDIGYSHLVYDIKKLDKEIYSLLKRRQNINVEKLVCNKSDIEISKTVRSPSPFDSIKKQPVKFFKSHNKNSLTVNSSKVEFASKTNTNMKIINKNKKKNGANVAVSKQELIKSQLTSSKVQY